MNLNPCPFCGSSVSAFYYGSHDWGVHCDDSKKSCGFSASFYIPHIGDENKAVEERFNALSSSKTWEQLVEAQKANIDCSQPTVPQPKPNLPKEGFGSVYDQQDRIDLEGKG